MAIARYKAERVDDQKALGLIDQMWRCSYHWPASWLPAGFHRFITDRQYAKERFQRLLIPFIWGVFVLAPPNAYFARRIHSDYTGSFLDFYPHFFEVGRAPNRTGLFFV